MYLLFSIVFVLPKAFLMYIRIGSIPSATWRFSNNISSTFRCRKLALSKEHFFHVRYRQGVFVYWSDIFSDGLSVCLSVCPSVCLYIHISISIFIQLSVCLYIHWYIHMFFGKISYYLLLTSMSYEDAYSYLLTG